MSVELLIAPPAAGKTHHAIQRLRAALARQPLAQVWVVVPDRLQAGAFRQRLAASGGALGGQVGRFEDLYHHLLERAGVDIPLASMPLLHRLVQEAVDASLAAGELSHYAALRAAPGFHLALRDSFAELKRSLIYPENFIESSRAAPPAQLELALLYSRYHARLRELNWSDPEGLGWLAVAALQRDTTLAAPIRLLIVDGFDSFTGVQRQALRLLSTQAAEILITFPAEIDPLDPSAAQPSARPAHRRFVPILNTLRADLSPLVTPLPDPPRLPPEIAFLERHIFQTSAPTPQPAAAPILLETRSPADEAREALRWVKARVLRDSVPLDHCAVFIPAPDVYHPLLRAAAAEFGIPLRFTHSDPLSDSPAISALLSLLALPVQNFKTRLLFNCLRSPYFNFAIDPLSLAQLEAISQAASIIEGLDQWDEIWSRLAPAAAPDYADLDDERQLSDLPRGSQAASLRAALDAFFARLAPLPSASSLSAWVAWLENLLDSLGFYRNAASQPDQHACASLRESLCALLLSESVTSARPTDFAGFLAELQGTLQGAGLLEPPDPAAPSLLVGTFPEARGLRFSAVALLGLSEGVFPVVERPDPFLSEQLRQQLGLEPRLEREQAGLFYQAITRADRFLLITRPYLSDDGEAWEASPYWNAARALFTPAAFQKIQPDQPRPLADAASPQELLFWAVRASFLPADYADLQPGWDLLTHAGAVLAARRARTAQGPYDGSAARLAPLLAARYSPAQTWSASRLESYCACPHMFYTAVALGLQAKAPPALGLGATQFGSLLHAVLEQVYSAAADPSDPASVLAVLPQVARQVFETAPRQFGFRPSPLWAAEQEEYLLILQATIQALAQEGSGWTPFAYEQTFGIAGRPLLSIDIGGETVSLHGVIDRLDRNPAGELRVIDYKTGASHLSQNDLRDGRRLQLPIYALAARDALHLGQPAEGFYWHIQGARSSPLKLSKFASFTGALGPEAAYQLVRDHLARIVRAIRAGDFRPIPPQGGCPSYCPAAQYCWRYRPGW